MAGRDIVVIGGSAGAVDAVIELVRGLPADLPAAVFVVIHFPTDASSVLPKILNRAGALAARHAVDGEPVCPGIIYVAPPNRHMLLGDGRVRLSRGPKENGVRPAIDPLFRTAATAYGPRVIAALLSGNLDDGTIGLRRVKESGGMALVQDPRDALYPGMLRSAIEHVEVDQVVPLNRMSEVIARLVGENSEEDRMADDHPGPDPEREVQLQDRQVQPGTPSTQTCPECHGTLWEVEDGDIAHFRCRIGHAFTAESLYAQQSDELEAALWTALRALEEHAALSRRMAARAQAGERARSSAVFTERALDAEHHAAVIRRVLEAGFQHPAAEPVPSPEEPAA